LTVDIISDVVCPWCFIGKRRLEKALRALGGRHGIRITWRPFELNPDVPREGIDRKAYREAKFGSLEASHALDARLMTVGATEGISFAFERIQRTPNTLDAHRLIWLAQREGLQDDVVEALFRGYFLEGRDVGDRGTLIEIGASNGLRSTMVEHVLESEQGVAAVRQEEAKAWQMGIHGVPHFVVNGRYSIPGAQNAEILASEFEEAMTMPAPEAAT